MWQQSQAHPPVPDHPAHQVLDNHVHANVLSTKQQLLIMEDVTARGCTERHLVVCCICTYAEQASVTQKYASMT